jgi:hypothetical protein
MTEKERRLLVLAAKASVYANEAKGRLREILIEMDSLVGNLNESEKGGRDENS